MLIHFDLISFTDVVPGLPPHIVRESTVSKISREQRGDQVSGL